MSSAIPTELNESAAALAYRLSAVGLTGEEGQRVEQAAIETAVKSAEAGFDVDAGTLWGALGDRLLTSRHPDAAELSQALTYFDRAATGLSDTPGEAAAETMTWALIGKAMAWSQMPLDDTEGVSREVMQAGREALSRCPRGPGFEYPQVGLLHLWGDLMTGGRYRTAVNRPDARLLRDVALDLLARRPALPEDAVYRATFALAVALGRLGDETGGISALRRAERLARALKDPSERGRCLGQLANALVARDGRAAYVEAARLHLRAATQFKAGGRVFETADSYRVAGVLLADQKSWEKALRAFRRSVSGWETVLDEAVLLPQADDATARLAETQQATTLCLVRLGRIADAVVAAEQGRTRRFRAIHRMFSSEFTRICESRPALADRYVDAHRKVRRAEIDELRQRESPSSATAERVAVLTDQMRSAKARLRELQDEIRAVPGLERSFAPPTLRRIRAAIPPGAMAVYVVSTPRGGAAILLSRQTHSAVPLPKLTSRAVSERLRLATAAYDGWRERRGADSERRLEDEIEAAGKWLWEAFMGRVLRASRGFERLILLPSDGLDFLPLHAAWCQAPDGGRTYALDVLPISLAPAAELQPEPPDGGWVKDRPLLTVAEPCPVSKGWGALPAARTEAAVLQAARAGPALEGMTATKEAVVNAIPEAGIIHMACHGLASFGLPYASFLLLAHDEQLQVSDIIDFRLGNRPFLFLSACETGAHDIALANEVQSLSGAFISAGASGVISTMWMVFDVSALLMTVAVYDQLFQGRDPASSLRHAQLWMRDVPDEEKSRDLMEIAWLPSSVKKEIDDQFRRSRIDPRSPLNWAAHVYSGA